MGLLGSLGLVYFRVFNLVYLRSVFCLDFFCLVLVVRAGCFWGIVLLDRIWFGSDLGVLIVFRGRIFYWNRKVGKKYIEFFFLYYFFIGYFFGCK